MNYITLFQLNQLIQNAISQQLEGSYWVVAEIGEMRLNQKGHCYLELVEKEERYVTAKIRANIWAYDYRNLSNLFQSVTGKKLQPGMKVLARVIVQFHEVYGLSLQIRDLDPNFTLGERARQRQLLIERLTKEGIIGQNAQLTLPVVPQRIAVVSASTAAGYGDFMDQLLNNRDGFYFKVDLFEALMQGGEAENSIVQAIENAQKRVSDYDLLVIIRGGGSQVDLDCFDSYAIASKVARFPLPVITGIGHERDETVVDKVAHTKIKTPTAVAEFLISGMQAFDGQLGSQYERLKQLTLRHIQNRHTQLFGLLKNLDHGAKMLISRHHHNLNILSQKLRSGTQGRLKEQNLLLRNYHDLLHKVPLQVIARERQLLDVLDSKISMADPDKILKRGYTLTFLNGKVVKDHTAVAPDDILHTRTYSRTIKSKVVNTDHE